MRKVKKTDARRRRDRRAVGLCITCFLCFGILFYRVWYWQSNYGDEFSRRVVATVARQEQNRASREIIPSRGNIVDRNMQPIASSQPVYNVFIDVNLLHAGRNTSAGNLEWEETLNALHHQLGIPRRTLTAYFETNTGHYDGELLRRTNHQYVAHQIPASVALPLRDEFRHVHLTELSQRWYHDPFFAPQVIGFIRGDATWGLEYQYDAELTGERGRNFWVQGEVEEIPVRDGFTLVTTLDADIQRLAQSLVDETYRTLPSPAESVAMIVQDPFTGEILAMAQAPTFSLAAPDDPDYITDVWLRSNWEYLDEPEQLTRMNRLWSNFHTTRSYEPGSIFKPIVIAAAIEEGVLSPHQTFYCDWIREIHDVSLRCWRQFGHGRITLQEAIYSSCNLAMIDIMNMLGRDNFYRYRGYFGFGERTGIDFPYELAVSSPAVMYQFSQLGTVQLATSSMGQGFNATSLQNINAFATLINGGNVMEPTLVSQIVDDSGNVVHNNTPQVVRRAISPQTSDFMRRELQHVVTAERGTGRSSAIPGHTIAGKTGTGQQVRDPDNPINSLTYIAYTPVENPEFLVLMVIDQIHDQNEVFSAGGLVAPVVRQFFEELIRMRGLQSTDGNYALGDWEIAMGAEIMPDFEGQHLLDVVRSLPADNGGFQVVGSGTRISHTIPAAGRLKPQNAPIFFHMDADSRIDGQMTIVPDVVGQTAEHASTLINAAGLTVALATTTPNISDPNQSPLGARTFNPPPQAINGEDTEPEPITQASPPEELSYTVYTQFPMPGTEVERGMQIIIRAR